MKTAIKRIGILFLIFMIGIVVYFMNARNAMEKKTAVYSNLEEPSLPVVYAVYDGKEINDMHGFLEDMGNKAAREQITVLPVDRMLKLHIAEYGNTITGIRYEIRNLAMDRLIERTEINDWSSENGVTAVTFPIQNLIEKGEDYLLSIQVDTAEKQINYYTRIMWVENTYVADMLELAENFTRKSLDYNEARELVTYLETNDREDNSSLGHVNIRSSFNHLTWDGLAVEMEGEPEIRVKEFDGIMGQLQVKYKVKITDEKGAETLVDTEDNYAMRWNEQRIYLMNYERYADELFTGKAQNYQGKRILLGISNEENIRSKKSPNGHNIAFTVNNNLWNYNQDDKKNVCIFSFGSEKDDGIRSGYNSHGIKILSVENDGTVNFLVYGYMNRGRYEGRMGVVCYSYSRENDTVEEKFFIPSSESYERMQKEVEGLSYLNSNGMIYLMLGGGVYGVDLKSNEFLVVAQGLVEGSFAVSSDGSRFAWQEGDSLYQSGRIHVMDFQTAEKQEIDGKEGDYVRVLGFVGNDLIYGFGKEKDSWVVNGRRKGLPMYAMYIADNQMNVQSEYRKDGIFIGDVMAEDGRIHLKRYTKEGEGQYRYLDEDTIVCNRKEGADPLQGIGWFASSEKGKVYFVQTDTELKASSVKTSVPKTFSYENTSMLEMRGQKADDSQVFYAYSGGRYLGAFRSFSKAVAAAYDRMGYVTDADQRTLWDRINRRASRAIKSPAEAAGNMVKYLDSFGKNAICREDDITVIDAGGCSLNQMFYFIDKGIPVAAYTSYGQYLLISGYDQYNVTLYDPAAQETWKMGIADAGAYFDSFQNDFVCGIVTK